MRGLLLPLAMSIITTGAVHAASPSAAKRAVVASIEKNGVALIDMSDQIWEFAETALREHRSSKLLADYAEKQGFKVTRNVAGMPTAFMASFGSGKPVIG